MFINYHIDFHDGRFDVVREPLSAAINCMANTKLMYGAILIILSCIVATSDAQSPTVTDATLLQVAASLQMYVDELPQLPELYGYTTINGVPKSANLTIGMYQTSWVRLLGVLALC